MTTGRLIRRVTGTIAATVALTAAFAAPGASAAPGQIFWSNIGNDAIGHATLINGVPSTVTQSLIAAGEDPCGVAVDATHVYWVNSPGTVGRIGRANLDGTGADPNFIDDLAAVDKAACGVAVDGAHIYWGNYGVGVGRANLDGTGVLKAFIPAGIGQLFTGVDVNATHLYVSDSNSSAIRRWNLDTTNPIIVAVAGQPQGVAVDASKVVWGGGIAPTTTTLGRADLALSPSSVNDLFITGGSLPTGPDLDANNVYWANFGTSTIGRAPITGGVANAAFIPALAPSAVAVIPVSADPPTAIGKLALGVFKKNKKKGTGSLTVNLPAGGTVTLGGSGVKAQTRSPSVSGGIAIPVKATGKKRKRLRSSGKVRLTLEVSFKPLVGGAEQKLSLPVKLKKKL